MKTLAAWIGGIFALGLALGSFVSGSSKTREADLTELESALDTAPAVDCGEGRDALLEPVVTGGETSFKVRCVPAETEQREARSERPVVVVQQPTAAVATSPAPERVEPTVVADDGAREAKVDDSRSWKESAVIIGGAAGAGAGIGAMAKGKKGAAVGAAIGAATATAYELIKRDKKED